MKRYERILFAACIAMILCAPAGARPLNDKQLAELRSGPVILCRREPQDMHLRTVGRSMASSPLGILGPAGLIADLGLANANETQGGEKVRKRFNVDDPGIMLSKVLTQRLNASGALGDVKYIEAEQPGGWDKAREYRKLVSSGTRVVSVRTGDWGIYHLDSKWDRYRVYYQARVSVLDPWGSGEYASAIATYKEDFAKAEDAPTLEQLLLDDASMLRAKLLVASLKLADELREKLVPAK